MFTKDQIRPLSKLRIRLKETRGPKTFDDLRTVGGNLCPTYRHVCLQSGLLEDDNIHHLTLNEASISVSSKQMRQLFAVLLTICSPSNPMDSWTRHSISMSKDIAHDLGLDMNGNTVLNIVLAEIGDLALEMGGNQLMQYGPLRPMRDSAERAGVDYIEGKHLMILTEKRR
ncbi:ATP-dependent helicase [Plakobranchus ocellatus]|uniref:ATP-dependent helicase n=1 Tax=Plakobranchus ocellatus TaxID=259542 RepID=A0AAV3XVD7_9GAST|nr:ATP-dependent helicase [Plakobranchus ocellatus]